MNNSNINKSFEDVLRESSRKKISIYSFKKTYPAYLILLFFIFISIFIYKTTKTNVEQEQKVQFDKAVQSVETRLNNLMQAEYEIIHSTRGLYDIVPQVVRDYFEIYNTVPVESYSSIVSISYILPVKNSVKGQFIYNSQTIGYYDYKIIPEGDRDEYFAVQMMVPFKNYDEKLLGYDIRTIPELKDAYEKARDEGKIMASDFFVFPIHQNKLTTFLFSPIYPKDAKLNTKEQREKNFQGNLGLEISVQDFFEEALRGGISSANNVFPTDSTIIFNFYELKKNTRNLIFSSKNANLLSTNFKPAFTEIKQFNIANKQIELDFYTIPNFGGTLQSSLPLIALGISLILSIVLFGFILSVITSRGRALDLAERMTRSQRRIVETTQDIIATIDFDGVWRSMNPASLKVLGAEPNDLIGKSIFDNFVNEKEINSFKSILSEGGNENTSRIDIRMKRVDNTEIWVNWSLSLSEEDGLVYTIGRDVTLEKKAEEEAKLRSQQIHLASYAAQEANEQKTLFMINASHQLRNSLTGVLGYLQLLNEKYYDNEEEMKQYLKLAEESSEEIFTFVSDFVDVALQGTNTEVNLEIVNLKHIFDEVEEQLKGNKIRLILPETNLDYNIQVSHKHLIRSLYEIISALTEGIEKEAEVNIEIEINDYEGVVIFQILTEPNPVVSELITIYKQATENIIDALKYDKDEIIFRFAKAASKIRIMNGQVTFDTFGLDDQNLSTITLPLKRQIM
jgi:PAS domain S-box-containing protein